MRDRGCEGPRGAFRASPRSCPPVPPSGLSLGERSSSSLQDLGGDGGSRGHGRGFLLELAQLTGTGRLRAPRGEPGLGLELGRPGAGSSQQRLARIRGSCSEALPWVDVLDPDLTAPIQAGPERAFQGPRCWRTRKGGLHWGVVFCFALLLSKRISAGTTRLPKSCCNSRFSPGAWDPQQSRPTAGTARPSGSGLPGPTLSTPLSLGGMGMATTRSFQGD